MELSRAPTSGNSVRVDYGLNSGLSTASRGSDFTLADGSVTFSSGETRKLVSFLTLSDTDIEGDELFGFDFSATVLASSGSVADSVEMSSGSERVSVAIEDDDDGSVPLISFSSPPSEVVEGSSATFTLAISSAPSADVTVTATASLGTLSGSPVTFARGSSSSHDVTLSVPDNSVRDVSRSVLLTLVSSSPSTSTVSSPLLVPVEDDESVLFRFGFWVLRRRRGVRRWM